MFEQEALLRGAGHEVTGFSRAHQQNQPGIYSEQFPELTDLDSLAGLAKIKQAFKLIRNGQTARKFDTVLGQYAPDIIHAHNIYGGLTTSILDVAKKRNIPVVLTLHDCKLVCPSYLMLCDGQVCNACKGRKFYHCLLKKCHRKSLVASAIYTAESYYNKWLKKWDKVSYYICPSRFMLNNMQANGFPAEKLSYIPNFVDPDKYQPEYMPGCYVLYVGRLSKEKGVPTLLKAMTQLPDVPLRIVGDGPERLACENFVSGNKLVNVRFEGYKSGAELAELYRNARFLVLPSECNENAPMTVLEAFAYGKPAIGSDLGGIPEMVMPGVTGMIFEHGNAGLLAGRIEKLWSDPLAVENMGRNGRQRVENEYSAERHLHDLLEVYKSALAGRK